MLRDFTINEVWYLVFAARWTLALTGLAFAGGGLLGLLFMTLRVLPFRPLNWLAVAYIQAIQGTPLLGQLFVFYFGFSIFGGLAILFLFALNGLSLVA